MKIGYFRIQVSRKKKFSRQKTCSILSVKLHPRFLFSINNQIQSNKITCFGECSSGLFYCCLLGLFVSIANCRSDLHIETEVPTVPNRSYKYTIAVVSLHLKTSKCVIHICKVCDHNSQNIHAFVYFLILCSADQI